MANRLKDQRVLSPKDGRPPRPYPFRFYGHAPADWAEGANAGHAWEVRFESAPGAATRVELARAWAGAVHNSPVATAAWVSAGDWALIRVGEDEPEDCEDLPGHYKAFFDGVEAGLRALHAVAPLVEVVFGNGTGGGTGAWESWSRKQQPLPSAYPDFGGYVRLYARALGAEEQTPDPSLGRGAADAASLAALHQETARLRSLAEAAAAPAPPPCAPNKPERAPKRSPEAVPVQDVPPLPYGDIQRLTRLHGQGILRKPEALHAAGGGLLTFRLAPGERFRQLSWLEADQRRGPALLLQLMAPPAKIRRTRTDGAVQALFDRSEDRVLARYKAGWTTTSLAEVDLPSGEVTVLREAPHLVGAAYLDDRRLLTLTHHELALFERVDQHTVSPLARLALGGRALFMLPGGRVGGGGGSGRRTAEGTTGGGS